MALVNNKTNKGTGVPVVSIYCSCGTTHAWVKTRYAYIMEERHSAYHGGYFGKSYTKVDSVYSTIVCLKPGCLGRRRVHWDPVEHGLKGLLWQEYVALKKSEGCDEIPLGNTWKIVKKNASPEWVLAHEIKKPTADQ